MGFEHEGSVGTIQVSKEGMLARSVWATLPLGIALGIAGVLLNNITFADPRVYWFAVPVAVALIAVALVILCVRLTRVGWPARVVSAVLLLALLQQLGDAALRRLPALLGV